jgi:FtsP/CotA-like multicopper oxidase with cupredoxin domain
MKHTTTMRKAITVVAAAAGLLVGLAAQAAVPGITGVSTTPAFNLTARAGATSQPDGALIYSWGYGCSSPTGFGKVPGNCPSMQMPGPTMIVTEGDVVTVTLTNSLPPAAGNTSIVFPGMAVTATGGVDGLLTQEAINGGGSVTYTFTASSPGTHAYYSGTQADLQIEMGMFGAIVVLPKNPATCASSAGYADATFSLATSAYGNADTCYDREYLFQFSELSSTIHDEVKAQVDACSTAPCAQILATMEPYRPNYYLINGRSMPDDMDVSYSPAYPNQPYNGNPHMHPGELVLMRVIGQGRWQHPFHFHGNHARVLARDANLMVSASDPTKLAGPLLFTIPTVPGQTVDAIFAWTGKGLNWDVYNHINGDGSVCTPDANGYHSVKTDANYGEWCADHKKKIPATPPDPSIVAIGQWYGGTPYLGLQTVSQGYAPTVEPPGTLNQNPQAGYAYMWHSHNEREITTNDVFPGGMMMMLLIDPPSWNIDETQ